MNVKKMTIACVAIFALASTANAQNKSENKYGTVKTQAQISYEDKEAWLEGRSTKTFTDLQVFNKDHKKAHHLTLGLGVGTIFADGAKPYAKVMAAYETRHFIFQGFVGGALNELPDGATIDPGKSYLGVIAGGEVDIKAISDEVYAKWVGLYGKYTGAFYRTDDASADYSSGGFGSEFGAGLVGNYPVGKQLSLRLNAGVASKIKVNHNESQWDNFRVYPDVQLSLVFHFNK